MKLTFIGLFTLILFNNLLFSQEAVIELKSTKVEIDKSSEEVDKPLSSSDSRDFLDRGQTKKITPKGNYIGPLEELYLDIDNILFIELVNKFCLSIKENRDIDGLDESYIFIFKTLYKDSLLEAEINNWFIGNILVDTDLIIIPIEVHLNSDFIFVGNIYIDNLEELKITDVHLEKKEKSVFDSSSPIILF